MTSQDSLDALIKALNPKDTTTAEQPQPSDIRKHPDWPAFIEQPFPSAISFMYINEENDEAYWDNMPVIKLDIQRLHLILEGQHGDPLRFDIRRISQAKNAHNGEKIQERFAELLIMEADLKQ